jgi:hypothetical protein
MSRSPDRSRNSSRSFRSTSSTMTHCSVVAPACVSPLMLSSVVSMSAVPLSPPPPPPPLLLLLLLLSSAGRLSCASTTVNPKAPVSASRRIETDSTSSFSTCLGDGSGCVCCLFSTAIGSSPAAAAAEVLSSAPSEVVTVLLAATLDCCSSSCFSSSISSLLVAAVAMGGVATAGG